MKTYDISTYETLSTIVRRLSSIVGFPKPADPAGSLDPAVEQMVAAVNMAGADMTNLYDWQNLCKMADLDIVADYAGQKEKGFDLPADFMTFVDQTQWNKNTQMPAIGPVSPQQWMQMQVRNPAVVLTFLWQVRDNQLWIQSPPDEVQVFTYMYMSRGWVIDADNQELYKNEASKNGDVILFDEYLMTLLARSKWLQIKGFDSNAAFGDFKMNYEIRKGKAKGAPKLSLVRRAGMHYLDVYSNLSDTGYGRRN